MTSRTHPDDEFLAPGSRFGKYVIQRLVGRGGMGAVYEASHAELKKRVAVKTLHARVAAAPEVRSRFRREGESAARIRHPHVVDIYDVGEEQGTPYLVMEYLEGRDLGVHLKRSRRLPPREIADLILPVVCALDVAHAAGVIHRDLKPSNLFLALGNHGEVVPKLVDFGISKIVDDQGLDGLTATGAVLGTPYYMSPEQAHGGGVVGARSDQYSLGVIVYQSATGERPFTADSMYQILHKIVEGDFQPPAMLVSDVPAPFEAALLRAMARRPDDRHPSILDFGRALLPYASPRVAAMVEPALGRVANAVPVTPASGLSTGPSWIEGRPPAPMEGEPLNPALTVGGPAGTQSNLHVPPRFPMLAVLGLLLLSVGVGAGTYVLYGTSPAPVVAVPLEPPASPESPTPEVAPPPPPAPVLPETYRARVEAVPDHATFTLDGEAVGVGVFEETFEKDGQPHVLEIAAEGYASRTLRFADAPPETQVALRPVARPKSSPRSRPPRKPTPPSPAEEPRRGTNEALIIR